ncbi:TPA: hypothetical protein WJI31_000377 [Neisseria meningitidis]
MTHLLERHRNARFMAHMDNFLPNWQSIKCKIPQNPLNSHQDI